MSKQIVLTLSNEFYQQVRRWAAIARRNPEEALLDAVSIALTPVSDAPKTNNPVRLSDEEILKQCRLEMDQGQAQRLGYLLEKQRQGTLTTEERRELESLIHVRNQLWIRRSEAEEEAERRGLRVPSPS